MNKYVYAYCSQDYWPEIRTILAKSYNDAVERLAEKLSEDLDDDIIRDMNDDFLRLQEYLNYKYTIALSNLEDIEEL